MSCTPLGGNLLESYPHRGDLRCFPEGRRSRAFRGWAGSLPNSIPFLCLVFSACLSELL